MVAGLKFVSEAGNNILVRKAFLWIEELWRSVQVLPSRDSGYNGLLDELR